MTDRQNVDRGLLDAVDSQHVVDGVVHERANPAGTKAGRCRRQVTVLADVTRLQQTVSVAAILVLGSHALEHLG